MPTPIKSSSLTLPASLGIVGPGASFATLSDPLTQNILPVNQDGSPDNLWNSLWIQAVDANVGTVYVCNSAAAPDLVAFTNVVGILAPGQWYPRTRPFGNSYSLTGLFIGTVNATDGALVVIDAA